MNLKNILLIMTLSLSLIGSVAGCGNTRAVILKDREQVTPHPTDPDKVCLDEGYLLQIFEELGK